MKACKNYIIVEVKKSTSTTKKTKSGLYVLNQAVEDTTKDGTKVDTTSISIVDVGPEANPELKPGQQVILNFYELQMFERDEKVYGVIPDTEVKVVL